MLHECYQHFNCQTYNIVSVIHCTICAKVYIGETGHTLDTLFKEHLADVKYHRDKPVDIHFNQAGDSIHDVRVKGLWLLFTDNVRDRKDMESYPTEKTWQQKTRGNKCKTFFLMFYL